MTILIRGGRLVDPASKTDGRVDLLIAGDRVVDRGHGLVRPAGADVIDAEGLLVLPGFVDMHTHSDFTLDLEPRSPARLHQGITTDVTGNCGFSPFPLPQTSGYGSFFRGEDVQGHASLDEFAEGLSAREPAINVAPLLGLGTVRTAVMGDAGGPASVGERTRMRELVEQALAQGAFGVSSGLVYSPGRSMDRDEIIEVLRPLSGVGRLYATHIRDERDDLVAAVEEAIDTAERLGVPLQLSHHKAVGAENWGRTAQTLRLVDEANRRGMTQVGLDYYPFTSGSTGLSSLLPGDSLSQGWARFRHGLTVSGVRERTLTHIRSAAQFRPEEVVLGRSEAWPQASGRPVTELAADLGISPEETILRLLEAEGEVITMLVPAASESDLRAVAAHPRAVHGSDAWLMTSAQARFEHPRNLTSTIRVLVSALTDAECKQADALTRAVHQLTWGPARLLGLAERGNLATGSIADVVIVDPARAPAAEGRAAGDGYPELVRSVLVNGLPALLDGDLTDNRNGRVLRAGGRARRSRSSDSTSQSTTPLKEATP